MGILDLLSELHQEPELKLNLKFEIEVLCKTLNLDINDLKPGMILKDQERRKRLKPQLSPRHKVDSPPLPPAVGAPATVPALPMAPQQGPPATPALPSVIPPQVSQLLWPRAILTGVGRTMGLALHSFANMCTFVLECGCHGHCVETVHRFFLVS